MCLSTFGIYQFPVKAEESHAANIAFIQLNLFEKWDLMALLRGDPLSDKQPDINQMVLI